MDILFFAVIAVFIFFKLRDQLGKVDEEQKREAVKKFIKEHTKTSSKAGESDNQNKAKIVNIPGVGNVIAKKEKVAAIDEKSQKILDDLDDKLQTDLKLVLSNVKLSPYQFLEGAKSAFETILSSFANGDLKTLKPLLSEKIFAKFEAAIQDRKSAEQILNTKIIAIDEAKITEAKMVDNFANIAINFTSKQINYIEDKEGNLTEGSKVDINNVNDSWVFAKDCSSKNPNWLLVKNS